MPSFGAHGVNAGFVQNAATITLCQGVPFTSTLLTMAISRQEVEKVSLLGRLLLTEAELDTMTHQLGDILAYMDLLGEVDTEHVEPMAHALDVANVFRDDKASPAWIGKTPWPTPRTATPMLPRPGRVGRSVNNSNFGLAPGAPWHSLREFFPDEPWL